MEIVKLIGADVLPDDQKLIISIARVIRAGFLQQNAFDDIDLGAISYNQNKNNLSNINNMDPNKLAPAIGQDTIVSIAQDKSEKE